MKNYKANRNRSGKDQHHKKRPDGIALQLEVWFIGITLYGPLTYGLYTMIVK